METPRRATPATPKAGHSHSSGEHGHGHGSREDWQNEEYVAQWLERQGDRAAERRRQFTVIRAMIPKKPDQEFRYLNLGAGPGNLDEVLLKHFSNASATLVDFSLMMLGTARQRLERFDNRVEYVHANLAKSDWAGAVKGPFDFVFATLAVHDVGEAPRIRDLYAEVYKLVGHGGIFLNMDYVRPSRPSLAPWAGWAAKDKEAGLNGRVGERVMPGTLLEQLGWLNEAGFGCVDVLWKDMSVTLFCAIRDHLHMPDGDGHGGHGAGGGHAH